MQSKPALCVCLCVDSKFAYAYITKGNSDKTVYCVKQLHYYPIRLQDLVPYHINICLHSIHCCFLRGCNLNSANVPRSERTVLICPVVLHNRINDELQRYHACRYMRGCCALRRGELLCHTWTSRSR